MLVTSSGALGLDFYIIKLFNKEEEAATMVPWDGPTDLSTTFAVDTTVAMTTEGWAEWSVWGTCTLTCGSGTRIRTRTHGTIGNDEHQIAACNTDSCRE